MRALLLTAALGLLTACMSPTSDGDSSMADKASMAADGAVTTEAQFRETLVGRTLTFEGKSLVVNADGTISGPWDGQGITGTWTWNDGAVCRDAKIGSRVLAPDCQVWTLDGSTAIVTRDRGNGASFVYTIS
ncbi:hypothetical protein [Cognatishimia sp. MH4019]|uniref:hypothetical protein n=1 Tax=Cognatishimia sp. MH4019 TaxID=2854030 RepID=UPI001CD34817|nr:hypothetical protein [Cognatishimia sp. MH4019]